MNLVDKTKPSMKLLVQELYTAGLFKDGAIAEMVGFGMFDASDYQDITGKPYSVKSNSSKGATSAGSTGSSTSTSNSTSQTSTASSAGSSSSNASSTSDGSDKK